MAKKLSEQSPTASRKPAQGLISNERGMTLIEIMIVIAIIAGLMAVLGANVNNAMKRSRVEQTKLQIKEVSKQLEAYNLACGSYPSSDQGLKALTTHPGNDVCPNWGPEPYYKKLPKDQWNQPFIYESDGSKFFLKSLGADKKEGGEGYDRDLSSEDE